jgi:hypothetical protein
MRTRGRALAAGGAVLAALAAGCAGPPLYGPAEPGTQGTPAASPTVSLQLFERAETGPAARVFQADAAIFNRDSKNPRVPASVLGEEAYQVSADIAAWSGAMSRAPVPPGYQQAKAHLLAGLGLLRLGYRHIGDGLLYGEEGQLRAGRADVRAGSRILAVTRGDVSL